jgi:hypothetical protein
MRTVERVMMTEIALGVWPRWRAELVQWRLRMDDRRWWWFELVGIAGWLMLLQTMIEAVWGYDMPAWQVVPLGFTVDPLQALMLNFWERHRVRLARGRCSSE